MPSPVREINQQSTTLRGVVLIPTAIRPEGSLPPPTQGSRHVHTDGMGFSQQPIHAGNQGGEVMYDTSRATIISGAGGIPDHRHRSDCRAPE